MFVHQSWLALLPSRNSEDFLKDTLSKQKLVLGLDIAEVDDAHVNLGGPSMAAADCADMVKA